MDALKTVLNNKPSITTVYFNEAGEWLFHPRAGFDKKMSREDVLAMKTATVGDDNPAASVEEAGLAKTATDQLLKKTEDAENLELEKSIFEEEKANFEIEKQEFEAAQSAYGDAVTKWSQANELLEASKGDLEASKAEVLALKEEVTKLKADLKKAKKNIDNDDITS